MSVYALHQVRRGLVIFMSGPFALVCTILLCLNWKMGLIPTSLGTGLFVWVAFHWKLPGDLP